MLSTLWNRSRNIASEVTHGELESRRRESIDLQGGGGADRRNDSIQNSFQCIRDGKRIRRVAKIPICFFN